MSPFEDAQAGGVIDLFLGLPDSKEKQAKKFDNIRAIANDAESKEMAMPAQYMFKGVPTYDQVDDPVALALGEMDKHNIRRALLGVHENEHAQRGFREHPDRFLGLFNVDPNQGMDAVRGLEHAVKETRRCTRCTRSASSSTCRWCSTRVCRGRAFRCTRRPSTNSTRSAGSSPSSRSSCDMAPSRGPRSW
jgi:hypothetical protein